MTAATGSALKQRTMFHVIRVHGVDAVLTPAGGEPIPARGIYHDPSQNRVIGSQIRVFGDSPAFHGDHADLGSLTRGDVVEVDSKRFELVQEPQRGAWGHFTSLELAQIA